MTEPRWVDPAGIWATDTAPDQPCAGCGSPSTLVVATERSGPWSAPYCTIRCWGDHMDRAADIRGGADPPKMFRGQIIPWHRVASLHAPGGPPGISHHRLVNVDEDFLTYRSPAGVLEGVLRRLPRGELIVHVDPERRGQGVGTKLAREAVRRWGIDLSVQHFTAEGLAMARRALPADRQI